MHKLIVANWKMYLTLRESVALAKKVLGVMDQVSGVDIILCPSFVALEEVGKVVKRTKIALGAQDVAPEQRGAFTGEVGLDDLGESGVQYVLVGHSERRRMFNETDAMVNKKLRAALQSRMKPILCVGEPLSVRKGGMEKVHRYVGAQVRRGLRGVSSGELKRVAIAYEPVWAIGSDRADTPENASETHGWIRRTVEKIYGGRASGQTEIRPRVLYGGSVNAKNAQEFLRAPNVGGLLIGRASINASEFSRIVKQA